jgi:hypothetical protein
VSCRKALERVLSAPGPGLLSRLAAAKKARTPLAAPPAAPRDVSTSNCGSVAPPEKEDKNV